MGSIFHCLGSGSKPPLQNWSVPELGLEFANDFLLQLTEPGFLPSTGALGLIFPTSRDRFRPEHPE